MATTRTTTPDTEGTSPLELAPDVVVAGRFRLVRPLGVGGMGSVWLAQHLALHIPCAVKFMRPEIAVDPSIRARFEREAVAAAQIRSPHVVQVLDHGVCGQTPFIAMELLEGEDLDQRLSRKERLTPQETVSVLGQVARALTRAHAAGLVHRDLKPANIFLVRDDDREIVKVLDFGIAKSTAGSPTSHTSGAGQTKTGAIMGTPFYMSPEQAQGTKVVDARSDLWALGVIAFQCLTGELPFVSDAFGDLVLKIIVEPLPVPSRVAAVPPGFDAWWRRAVDRKQEQRFQSAKEMVDALAEALGVHIPEGIGGAPMVVPDMLGATAVLPGSSTAIAAAISETSLPTPSRSRAPIALAALGLALVVALGVAVTRGPAANVAGARASAAAIAPTTGTVGALPSPVEGPVVKPAPPPALPSVDPVSASATPPGVASASSAPLAPDAGRVFHPRPAVSAAPAAPTGRDIGF